VSSKIWKEQKKSFPLVYHLTMANNNNNKRRRHYDELLQQQQQDDNNLWLLLFSTATAAAAARQRQLVATIVFTLARAHFVSNLGLHDDDNIYYNSYTF
jgi:hypothetical protein